MKIRPIILSGGSGTRLWPVSRAKAPKQFVPLTGDDNLFITTLQSLSDHQIFATPAIVGNIDHRFLMHDALEAAKLSAAFILLEPTGRNTAAAAIAAALAETDKDVLHLVRPSDHVISDLKAWHAALAKAVPAAETGSIVLFGIKPDRAETGYGYILQGQKTSFDGVTQIASFKEKPDASGAAQLIKDGALWNSGIFLYAPETLLNEAKTLAPDLVKKIQEALDKAQTDARGTNLEAAAYADIASEPFDRVIMERTKRGAVVPCQMGWNDVGAWQALWETGNRDKDSNVLSGPVVAMDSTNSYVRSEGPAVAVLGMKDVAVVATKDAVLVTPLARTQDVKQLVTAVEQSHSGLAQEHARARRPWGSYETVAYGTHFQVKHIIVQPNRSLSLQMHHHRAEHWIVVAGTAEIQCDDIQKLVFPNESVYIPKGAKHRLSNPGMVELHLIEVQSGDYLGEDDIIRFADNYGRSV